MFFHFLINYYLATQHHLKLQQTMHQRVVMSAVCRTATMGFLVLARALFIHFCNYYLSMLKRIGIGSVLTFICALYILLINCLEYTTSIGERYINIIAYLNLVIPMVLFEISYIALKVSLLEFIIAQSPHNMKGILIHFLSVANKS